MSGSLAILVVVVVLVMGCAGAAVGLLLARRRAGATSVAGYRVEAVLGSGSTSTVYLGRDSAGRQVAVKVLYRLGTEDRLATRTRVDREVAALRAAASPHLPQIQAVTDDPAGVVVVIDFVEGATLSAVLARNGRLSGPAAAGVLEGALLGLADLHAAGLVHRDVKPDNIVVTGRGQSRLVDFGLAQSAGTVTTGPAQGSPVYMSPEQAAGHAVDARSDVWSCGAVLFETLAGSRVRGLRQDAGTTPEGEARAALDRAGVAGPLAQLTARALATDVAARPADAGELLAELRERAGREFGADWRVGAGLGALAASAGARAVQELRPHPGALPALGRATPRSGLLAPAVGALAGVLVAAAVSVPLALSAHDGRTTQIAQSLQPSGSSASTGPASPAPTTNTTATASATAPPAKLNLAALMVPRMVTGAGFIASQPVTAATLGTTVGPLLLPGQLVKDGMVAGRYEFFSGLSSEVAYIYLFQLAGPAQARDWLTAAAASGGPAFADAAVPGANGVVYRQVDWVRFVRGPVVGVVGASGPGAASLAHRVAAAQYAKLAAGVPG